MGLDWTSLASTAASVSSASSPAWGGLVVAFALGLVHALDADHVMALSVFATRDRDAVAGARAGLHWSLGHGLVLLAVGLVFILVGRSLPESIAAITERGVGVVMIGLGLSVFASFVRRRAHLHFHRHDGLRPHAHWHAHSHAHHAERTPAPSHQHEHGALLVGALHGLAGSAPILVVLPVAYASPGLAFAYLVVFGLGVATAMAVVSGLLGHAAGRLALQGNGRGWRWLRGVGAAGSVALGSWLAFAG